MLEAMFSRKEYYMEKKKNCKDDVIRRW
jgi:hypothetical protein